MQTQVEIWMEDVIRELEVIADAIDPQRKHTKGSILLDRAQAALKAAKPIVSRWAMSQSGRSHPRI